MLNKYVEDEVNRNFLCCINRGTSKLCYAHTTLEIWYHGVYCLICTHIWVIIDEGFGALDAETLDAAVLLLDSIRSDGRSIGIITHVDQMQKTLPIGMKIIKSSRGSSIQQIDHLAVVE